MFTKSSTERLHKMTSSVQQKPAASNSDEDDCDGMLGDEEESRDACMDDGDSGSSSNDG
jgi:hypothetical protein